MEKREGKNKRITSPIKKKMLLILGGALALGLTRNPRSQEYVFKRIKKEWNDVDRRYFQKIVREFKEDRLVNYKTSDKGEVEMILTEKGKKMVLKFDIDRLKIARPMRWDRKWRVVFFDIPEKRRIERNVLRNKLKELGFGEIQKSVFAHPFPCLKEINFIIEYFQLRNLVRYGEMINISNEEELKLKFKLY